MRERTVGFRGTERVVMAVLIAMLACVATILIHTHTEPRGARDFTFWWRAGQALLDGQSPYVAIRPTGPYPYNSVFAYPLPAALVGVLFTPFRLIVGAGIFVGTGFALLSYALLGMGTWRLFLLASAPALAITLNGQWSPFLLAAALTPALGWLLAVKPTIGAALFLWRPNWPTFLGGAALALGSFVVLPTWPLDWMDALSRNTFGAQYVPPLLMPGGAVLALVALRWRRPEARLIGALACVPQNALLYDQLPLMMVPAGPWSLAAFAAWSNVVWGATTLLVPRSAYGWLEYKAVIEPILIVGLYFPALAMVLLRPNAGAVPEWMERAVSRWPRWLRGTAGQGEVAAGRAAAASSADERAAEEAGRASATSDTLPEDGNDIDARAP